MNIFNYRYRKVGGIRFLRLGRLQFSFCLCSSFAPRERSARSGRNDALTRTQLAPVREVRCYPGGSTVVVYDDR